MKQNYKIRIIFLGCLVFGMLSLGILIKPLPALAGTGNVTVGKACVSDPNGANDNCIAALNCVNGVCLDPNATANPVAPTDPNQVNPITPSSCTQGTCPSGLCSVNGLCLPPSQYNTGIAGSTTLSGFIITVIKILLSFAGVIAVVMLVIGGYWYMAAGGNEETAEKGKKTIINFVLGLVVIILAYTIVTIISATLTGADKLLQ